MLYRDPEHHYWLNGRRILGLSEVLRLAGMQTFWQTKQCTQTEAMTLGTAVHLVCQQYDEGEAADEQWHLDILSDQTRPYLDQWIAFCRQSKIVLEPEFMEVPVANEKYEYACTPDRVGMIRQDRCVLEIKTGSPAPWHELQLEAQARALDLKDLKRLVVYLSPDGYKLVEFTNNTRAWLTFQAALTVAKWKVAHNQGENHG